MYQIQFHSLEIYGWKRDFKISKEQEISRKTDEQKDT